MPREALEDRSLAEGNRPVLLGMTETAVSEAVELRRHRGRRVIPGHPPVDARIGSPRTPLVTIGDEILVPVPPGPSGAGGLNPPQVGG